MIIELKIAIIKKFGAQADFSEALGNHESKVSQIVRGRRKLTPFDADRWEMILGCKREILPIMGGKHGGQD